MKTAKFLLFVAAGLVMTSCTSTEEEFVDSGKVAPQISAELAGMATRAYDATWENGDQIGITCSSTDGTNYTNYQYATTGTLGNFDHVGGVATGIFYQGKEDVTFTAYYPFTGTEGTAPVCNVTTEDQTTAKQKTFDYLFAPAITASKAAPIVKFTGVNAFKHCMTRVVLRIVADEDADVELNELKPSVTATTKYFLDGVKLNGSFNYATGVAAATSADTENTTAWAFSDKASEGSYVFPAEPEGVATQPSVEYSLILYPQTAAPVFRASINNAIYTCNLTPVPALEAGKMYIYKIKVSKTGLQVISCTINDWTKEDNSDCELNAK